MESARRKAERDIAEEEVRRRDLAYTALRSRFEEVAQEMETRADNTRIGHGRSAFIWREAAQLIRKAGER